MMRARGHYLIHYGHEDSQVDADEHVTVTTNKDLEAAYGSYDWKKNFFKFNTSDAAYQAFYLNAIREVGKRKQPLDFILPFWGAGVRPVCDAHNDLIVVEPGIGYAGGHWARWKVFESYAIYHAYCGLRNVGECRQDWYEVVIPNYFDPEEFEYCEKKEDYFLYLGRVYDGKGVNIAVQVTQKIGAKLVVAGQMEPGYQLPSNVEYVGYADRDLRRELMKKAKASFVPSMYIEPFGGVQVENLMCGTPTITTDWGAFVENNPQGVTGYRCRTFEDFVNAALEIDKIDNSKCRAFAENFTLDKIAPKYEKYFGDVMNVHTCNGWYQIGPICDYNQIDAEEGPFAVRLAEWIKKELNPPKAIDIGCGPGTYVKALNDSGVSTIGYDIDPRVNNKPNLVKQDLFNVNDPADVVLCLEVAEHIHSNLNDRIVESIMRNVRPGGYLIFSAAAPGQGGIGHINCRPKDYWAKKFVKAGLSRSKRLENVLLEYIKQGYHMGWFINNCLVFWNKPANADIEASNTGDQGTHGRTA